MIIFSSIVPMYRKKNLHKQHSVLFNRLKLIVQTCEVLTRKQPKLLAWQVPTLRFAVIVPIVAFLQPKQKPRPSKLSQLQTLLC